MSSLNRKIEITGDLADRMQRLGVREEDLEENFIRSSGPGGQNVNKTATCVLLLHRPSGIQVRSQSSRYQGRNRLIARRLLIEKLERQMAEAARARRAEQEKVKRQKRGRSRAAKERILADKAHHSTRKSFRRPFPVDT